MKKKLIFSLTTALTLAMVLTNAATTLTLNKQQVISDSTSETTLTLGADNDGPLVVFTKREMLSNSDLGPGDIYYQRHVDGALPSNHRRGDLA